MNEKRVAFKIASEPGDLVCQKYEFEEHNMLDLLLDIQASHSSGIYWIFKHIDGKPQEAMSIIDCDHQRIYYHFSGLVEDLNETIRKLQAKG